MKKCIYLVVEVDTFIDKDYNIAAYNSLKRAQEKVLELEERLVWDKEIEYRIEPVILKDTIPRKKK